MKQALPATEYIDRLNGVTDNSDFIRVAREFAEHLQDPDVRINRMQVECALSICLLTLTEESDEECHMDKEGNVNKFHEALRLFMGALKVLSEPGRDSTDLRELDTFLDIWKDARHYSNKDYLDQLYDAAERAAHEPFTSDPEYRTDRTR